MCLFLFLISLIILYRENKMKILSNLTTQSKPWLLLALSALALEICALFFQYAMDLAPCIMCVYQRAAIASIILSGFIGFVGYKFILARIIAYGFWGMGAIWGLLIALEHVEIQANSGSLFFSCEFIPNFPTWAPLHEWLPIFFEATGDCGDINWQFLGYSMPQWMIVVYSTYILTFATIIINRFLHAKKL